MNLLTVLASEAPNGKFLPGDVKEFYWGIVAFVIVFGLLAWKVLPVFKKALATAREEAQAEANSADNAVAAARAEVAALQAEVNDAGAAAERIIAEAHETAHQLRVDQNSKTQQLVNDMWEKAQGEVVSMKTQAVSDIQNEVSVQALGAAEEVVKRSLDANTQTSLIDDYINRLGVSS